MHKCALNVQIKSKLSLFLYPLPRRSLVLIFLTLYCSKNVYDAAAAAAAKSLQSCLTLCDPMDCSPPGSSVHGIFQARVLEWNAIAFSEEYP